MVYKEGVQYTNTAFLTAFSAAAMKKGSRISVVSLTLAMVRNYYTCSLLITIELESNTKVATIVYVLL